MKIVGRRLKASQIFEEIVLAMCRRGAVGGAGSPGRRFFDRGTAHMILRSCGHVEPHGHMVRDGHMIQCQRWSGTGGEGRGRGRGEKKKGRGMGGEGRGREEGRERNGMGRGGKRRGFGRYVRSKQVWGRLRRIDLGQPEMDELMD